MKPVLNVALLILLTVSITAPVLAGDEEINIFKTASEKQTAAEV
jgi:biopolymer transport protein ExbD